MRRTQAAARNSLSSRTISFFCLHSPKIHCALLTHANIWLKPITSSNSICWCCDEMLENYQLQFTIHTPVRLPLVSLLCLTWKWYSRLVLTNRRVCCSVLKKYHTRLWLKWSHVPMPPYFVLWPWNDIHAVDIYIPGQPQINCLRRCKQ